MLSRRCPRPTLALLLVVGLQSCDTQPEQADVPVPEPSVPAEDSPNPEDSALPNESIPNVENPLVQDTDVGEPATSRCEQLLEVIPDTPEWLEVVYEDEQDPVLVSRYGWQPMGLTEGLTIRLWPDEHPTEEAVEVTRVHEVGHFVDHLCLSRDERDAYAEERGITGEWYGTDFYRSPSEDYADAFAVCTTGTDEWWTMERQPPAPESCEDLFAHLEGLP